MIDINAELIFLEPVFMERPWGGRRLVENWGYKVNTDKMIGECWGVSAMENGDCKIASGAYKGKTLSSLWNEKRELFGNIAGEQFPLLTKILDADSDLSIQVHPDDEYARVNENASGKSECWYILDCPSDATLIIGNKAKDKNELVQMIEEERWNDLCNEIKVKKGDFIQIDSGTLHSLKAGFTVLETQQSSDITYRVYDFDRIVNGSKRELHIKRSIDVIQTPGMYKESSIIHCDEKQDTMELLCDSDKYRVWELSVASEYTVKMDYPFLICSVVEGEGYANDVVIKKGQHFIVPATFSQIQFKGNMKLILSTVH